MKLKMPWLKFGKEYFLLLLPFYFVFHGFVENYVSVSVPEALALIAQYLLATALLCFIFFFLLRSWRKTALYVFALMAFHFFFGAMHDTAKQWFPNAFFVKYVFILPLVLIAFLLLAFFVYRSKKNFDRLVRFLNLLFIVLILVDVPFLLNAVSKEQKPIVLQQGFSTCDTCSKPDIYLIVADEYAGQQELNEIFHFDNTAFENAIQSKGFHIIKNSKSNYNYTLFSMASLLSMNFLNNIEGKHFSRKDINTCYNVANKSSLWNFLTANGYEIKNYSFLNINNIPAPVPQDFLLIGKRLITSQTFLSRMDRDIRFNLVTRFKIRSEIERAAYYTKHGNEKLYNALLEEPKEISVKPRFVYTHLMMPHYPYYFDSAGKPYPLEEVTEGNQSKKQHYIQYLQYCNRKFITLIDTILKNSKEPPVIIFLGDHGWRHFTEPTDHNYYFMNLSSVYLPNKNYSSFYDGMSNVNVFRALLNTEFYQKLDLLKDSTVYIED